MLVILNQRGLLLKTILFWVATHMIVTILRHRVSIKTTVILIKMQTIQSEMSPRTNKLQLREVHKIRESRLLRKLLITWEDFQTRLKRRLLNKSTQTNQQKKGWKLSLTIYNKVSITQEPIPTLQLLQLMWALVLDQLLECLRQGNRLIQLQATVNTNLNTAFIWVLKAVKAKLVMVATNTSSIFTVKKHLQIVKLTIRNNMTNTKSSLQETPRRLCRAL